MEVKSESVHTKGRQGGVVKRRMKGRVGLELGQDIQVHPGPGDGLEARDSP